MNAAITTVDLTSRQETFAQLVATGSSLTDAYVQAYDSTTGNRQSAQDAASALYRRPLVKARVRELRLAVAEKVVVAAAELRLRQMNIAFAPALTHTKAFNCRHCPTDGKHYSWADAEDYAAACDAWQAAKGAIPQPSALGGFTWDAFAPPNPRCRKCRGVGERFVYGPLDTTQLDPELAAAYRGASVDGRSGVVKIEQADPDEALRQLTAMTPGGYAPKQSESKSAVEHTVRVVPAEMTVEEARAALAHHRRAPVTIDQSPAAAIESKPA